MNKLKQAVTEVQLYEGYTGPETLTMYKQAAASIPLQDSYPRVAKNISDILYKTASDNVPSRSVDKTILIATGLTKLAGVDPSTKEDTMLKLAAVVSMHGDPNINQDENDVACYHLIRDLIGK